MKLSRALLIVLVLHIVAVAGIVAFNTIKTREAIATAAAPTEPVATQPLPPWPQKSNRRRRLTMSQKCAMKTEPRSAPKKPAAEHPKP